MIPTRIMRACVAIAGLELEQAEGPRKGLAGHYELELPGQSYWVHLRGQEYSVRFAVDIDEDGRARLAVVEQRLPDPGIWMSPLERALLDGLAEIIALDMLRERSLEDPARC